MTGGDAIPQESASAAMSDLKAFLRVCDDGEDLLLRRLASAAIGYCEAFTRRTLLARDFTDTVGPRAGWMRLSRTPVLSIGGVERLPGTGDASALPADAYAIDIDAGGDGWVRLTAPISDGRVRISYSAGIAADWSDAPEALRHGIIRLGAHLYTHRDGAEEGPPPAAVTALWQPWRRIRLG